MPLLFLLIICLCTAVIGAGCTSREEGSATPEEATTNPVVVTTIQDEVVRAQSGDNVSVYYTGTYVNGTVFDYTTEGDPLTFTIGSGEILEGFENAVIGLAVGENTTVTIPAADAYGEWSEDNVLTVPLEIFGTNATITEGMSGYLNGVGYITILNVTNDTAVIDANHPLAGYDLVFEIELVSIN